MPLRNKISYFFILFILLFSPVCLHANTTLIVSDVAPYTRVNTLSHFKNLVETSIDTLQPKLVLNVSNTDINAYSKVIEQMPQVKSYHLSLSQSFKNATLTVTLELKQAYRIFSGLKSDTAYKRLSKSDLSLLNTAQTIINKITTTKMNDFEKELAIHDYIINHTSYDYDNLLSNTLPDSAYTAAGILINKTGVCEGYSEAVKLLLNLAGIECEIVYGSSTTNASHAWNIVKIDKDWYMLDTTFDDPIIFSNDERVETISYEYFNVTNSMLLKDHSWNTINYPSASATAYNYFNYYHKVAYTYEDFRAYIITQLQNNQKDIDCYIYNYNPSTYNLNFIFNYYKGRISYTAPSGKDGVMKIRLT